MSGYMAQENEVADEFKGANQLTLKEGNDPGLLERAQCYHKGNANQGNIRVRESERKL